MNMDLVQYQFFLGSIIFWSAFLLCDLSLKHLHSRFVIYPIMFVFYGGLSCLYYFYPPIQTVPYISYIFATTLMLILPFLYKNKITKILFVIFSSILFSHMAILCSLLTINIVPEFFPDIDTISYQIYIETGFHVAYLLCILIFLRILFKKGMKHISDSSLYILWLYPIACYAVLQLQSSMILTTKINNDGRIAIGGLLFVIYVSYFIIYLSIPKKSAPLWNPQIQPTEAPVPQPIVQKKIEKVYVQDETSLLKSEKKYYEQIINTYSDMSERTHLLDQHLRSLNQLLMKEDIAAAKAYLDQISRSFHDIDMLIVSDRQVINSLVSYYHYLCLRYQIEFDVKMNLPQYMDINESDLCILLGNTLINAIEACQYLPMNAPKFIHLDCRMRNGEFLIICDNSFDGFMNRVKDVFKSRKQQEGSGIAIIQSICDLYNGRLEIEYPQKVFSIYITLPCIRTKKDII